MLYAGKEATDGVRANRSISITRLEREQSEETYDVTAYAADATGRIDAAIGSVSIKGLHGEALSNAKMKAETKAKRRVTLSISGLGMLDELEVGSIPGAAPMNVDLETGEIMATEVRTLREIATEAQEAAEGPQVAEVVVDTAPAPPEAPEALQAVVEPPTTPTEGMTQGEFLARIRAAHVFSSVVSKTARSMFGEDAESVAALTDEQRGQLWAALLAQSD